LKALALLSNKFKRGQSLPNIYLISTQLKRNFASSLENSLKMSIERFVRFVDENGAVAYGELPLSATTSKLEGISVPVLSGNPFDGFSKAGRQAIIKKV
jgi:hypothetical protein